MAGEPTLKQRRAGITDNPVQPVPPQVMNQNCEACHAQRFVQKLANLFWFEMVKEQR